MYNVTVISNATGELIMAIRNISRVRISFGFAKIFFSTEESVEFNLYKYKILINYGE